MLRQSALSVVFILSAASSLTTLAPVLAADALSPASPPRSPRQLAQQQQFTHRGLLSAQVKPASPSHSARSASAASTVRSLSFNADGVSGVDNPPPSRHVGLQHHGSASHARSHRESDQQQSSPVSASTTPGGAGHEAAATSLQPHPTTAPVHKATAGADAALLAAHEAAEDHSDSRLDASSARSHPALSAGSVRQSVPLSTHECWWEGTPEEEANFEALTPNSHHTVCCYTNLLIWNQQVYYVAKEPHPHLPKVRTAYEGSMWMETLDIKVVSPESLPKAWPAAPTQTLAAVLFWYISHFGNYGHIFGEHAPNMHVLACNYLGYCDYGNAKQRHDLHILFTNTRDKELVWQWPPQVNEMWQCWSDHQPTLLYDPPPERQDQLILVKSAAAGIGPKCRSLFFCRPYFGAGPPDAEDMEGFRQRVTACFGIPGNTTLDYMAPPLVAVMNRPPGKGRSIHNGDEVAALLHQQFSGQGAIVKHIRFNEAMTIREQAAVYNQIAVLVQVHGAGLANAIFLPRGAIVVDIMQKGFYARISWSMRWVRDYKNLQLSYVPLAEQLSHLLPVSLDSPEYQDLTPQERAHVDQADCPRPELQEKCSWWWWYGSSVIVDGFQAEQAVWVAMHQIGRGTP